MMAVGSIGLTGERTSCRGAPMVLTAYVSWEHCRQRDSGVRLEVPASAVGLEGHVLNGMAFTLYGGRATWDHAGKASAVNPSSVAANGPSIFEKWIDLLMLVWTY